jgi:virginiamycin B lyase
VLTNVSLANSNNQPLGIIAGPDNAVWFTEYFSNLVGRLSTTNFAVSEFPVPTVGAAPYGITAGSDGNIWFTESLIGQVGRVNLSSNNVITEFLIPSAVVYAPGAAFMVNAPDGSIYFTEYTGNAIGQILLAGPTLNIHSLPNSLVVLSWPTNAVGFLLQSKSLVLGGTWTTISTTPSIVGTNYVVTNSSAGFSVFRLIR